MRCLFYLESKFHSGSQDLHNCAENRSVNISWLVQEYFTRTINNRHEQTKWTNYELPWGSSEREICLCWRMKSKWRKWSFPVEDCDCAEAEIDRGWNRATECKVCIFPHREWREITVLERKEFSTWIIPYEKSCVNISTWEYQGRKRKLYLRRAKFGISKRNFPPKEKELNLLKNSYRQGEGGKARIRFPQDLGKS